MSFKLFIYYCALCGGWAAFLAWGMAQVGGFNPRTSSLKEIVSAPLTAGVLGLLVAGAVGAMDALLNAVGSQRLVRVGICLAIGLVGGLVGGLIGQLLYNLSHWTLVVGWILMGVAVGASVGVFDLVRAVTAKEDRRAPLKKVLNGVLGGLVGGLMGGLPFGFLAGLGKLDRSGLAIGLVMLGACVGLMIGLAQVFLKEAWIKVESGFRAGREVMLTKDATTIGRAESCDIGLFRDNTIERLHAKISLQANRYYLSDENTPAGTFVNNARVSQPTPLKNGDLIRVGSCELRFGERQKRT